MRRILFRTGLTLALLLGIYVASWFLFAPKLSANTPSDGISPYTTELQINATRPLSSETRSSISLDPAVDYSVRLGWSIAGPNTRLIISFREPLQDGATYRLSVAEKGWGRDGTGRNLTFQTKKLHLDEKVETSNDEELNSNPLLKELPHFDTHFKVEWSTTDEQNRYVLDVTVYAGYGETPDQALRKYRPEAERWLKGTGQPSDTYVVRYQVQQLVGE